MGATGTEGTNGEGRRETRSSSPGGRAPRARPTMAAAAASGGPAAPAAPPSWPMPPGSATPRPTRGPSQPRAAEETPPGLRRGRAASTPPAAPQQPGGEPWRVQIVFIPTYSPEIDLTPPSATGWQPSTPA